MSDGTDALGKGRHDGVKTYVLENGLRECGKKGNGMTFLLYSFAFSSLQLGRGQHCSEECPIEVSHTFKRNKAEMKAYHFTGEKGTKQKH